jgi:hypothetical protein
MLDTKSCTFNHQRGATDAQSAPLAIVMHTPGIEAVLERMEERFYHLLGG